MKGKITVLPRTCANCNHIIPFLKRHYSVYLLWKTEDVWKRSVMQQWIVCEKCYQEYQKKMEENVNRYFIQTANS